MNVRRFRLLASAAAVLACLSRPAAADSPWGLQVDSKGNIYVTTEDLGLSRLWKVGADGKKTLLLQGVYLREVRLDRDETPLIIRVDRGFRSSELLKVGARTPIARLESPASRPGSSYWGQFVQGDNGVFYFGADQTLMAVRPGLPPSLLAGGRHGYEDGRGKDATFNSITGMAWGPDHALYVADVHAVRRVTPGGNVTTLTRDLMKVVPGDDTRGHPPNARGIVVADDGTVYVAVDAYLRVSKLTPDGKLSVAARTADRWEPQGVALHQGKLYVSELKWDITRFIGPRIRVFEPDGSSKVVADLTPEGPR
ncbi:MAG: hypothetical protein U0835_05375 [Isosphaeraceae bacterium]